MLQNVPIISKDASNKSITELNFLRELGGRVSLITPEVELRSTKDVLPFQ